MSNDCGCTKKIVDKIYEENSCCKPKKDDCSNINNCCTSCGKQIDLIDSDLYADNIYNYQEEEADKLYLQEGKIIDSSTRNNLVEGNLIYREEIYNLLESYNNQDEIIIRLKKVSGILGVKSIASLKKLDSTYILIYVKQFKDDTVISRIPNKTIPIRTNICVYTNNYSEATYTVYDCTYYTCEEILNILLQYYTKEELESYLNLNYYNITTIDGFFGDVYRYIQNNYFTLEQTLTEIKKYFDEHITTGEDCLFENGLNDTLTSQGKLSTLRKDDNSEASGINSFAIQGGKASGENSFAIEEGDARGKNSLAGIKSSLTSLYPEAIVDVTSESSISLIGSKIYESKNSVAISDSSVSKSDSSLGLMGGRITNSKNSISIGNDSNILKVSGGNNKPLITKIDPSNDPTNEEVYSNLAMFGGKCSGRYAISIGAGSNDITSSVNNGSIAIGQDIYAGGWRSTVIGYQNEIGRYCKERKLDEPKVYIYGDDLESRGCLSNLFGAYSTIYGPYNFAAGERHFINGALSFSGGSGNTIKGYCNTAFGTRNIVEGLYNFVGGKYSISRDLLIAPLQYIKSFGSFSFGKPFEINKLFIKKDANNSDEYRIYYYDSNNNIYVQVPLNSKICDYLENSDTIKRTGEKLYLASIIFAKYDIENGKTPGYPGVDNYTKDDYGMLIKLTRTPDSCNAISNSNGYYEISLELSYVGNVTFGKGSSSIGIGNQAMGNANNVFGLYNKIAANGCLTCGQYNKLPQSSDKSKSIFVIGSGNYNAENYTINRINTVEVFSDNKVLFILNNSNTPSISEGVSSSNNTANTYIRYDLYKDIIEKYNDLLEKLKSISYINSISINNGVVTTTTESILSNSDALSLKMAGTAETFYEENLLTSPQTTNNIPLSQMPGYIDGYVRVSESIVYDPNNVIQLGEDNYSIV